MNPIQIKVLYLKYVDEHEFLADYAKPLLKEMIERQFAVMSQVVGTTELICLRRDANENNS